MLFIDIDSVTANVNLIRVGSRAQSFIKVVHCLREIYINYTLIATGGIFHKASILRLWSAISYYGVTLLTE